MIYLHLYPDNYISAGLVKSYSQIDPYGLKFWSYFYSDFQKVSGVRCQDESTRELDPDTWHLKPYTGILE